MGATGSAAAPPGFPRIEGEFDFLLVSLLSLYLEILLIRWIGTEIRIFAYFANLVLVTCFFGLGVGYATPRVRMSLAHGALAPLGFRQISEAVATRDVLTWTLPTAETATRVLGFARLAFLLLGIALAFVPFGRALGDYFEREPRRLRDQRRRKSARHLAVRRALVRRAAAAGLVRPARRDPALHAAPRAARRGLRGGRRRRHPRAARDLHEWRRGHDLVRLPEARAARRVARDRRSGSAYSLEVNNTLYQYVLDLSDANLDRAAKPLPAAERPFYYYNLPYRLHEAPERVLVVGSGTGNDVAAALRNGATHVDAVEIDAAIVEIGRRVHPEKPYDDARVNVVIDDARSYFKRSRAQYDLIVFGLLDSTI
jgi:hypothetical protein